MALGLECVLSPCGSTVGLWEDSLELRVPHRQLFPHHQERNRTGLLAPLFPLTGNPDFGFKLTHHVLVGSW